jgi:hypothetical protein
MTEIERRIIQIIPTSQKTNAVFLVEGNIIRDSVVCFALVEEDCSGKPLRYVVPMYAIETGIEFCDEYNSQFIGLEFDGKEHSWEQEKESSNTNTTK